MSDSVQIGAEVWQGLGVTPWHLRDQASAPVSDNTEQAVAKKWVLIGRGLDRYWQNPQQPAWWLWQAMIEFHFASDEHVVFFDTETIQSEEQVYAAIEKVIELGEETIYSMDDEHPLHECLAEGAQVVRLPDFESMLAQPMLKRDVYQSLAVEWQ